MRSVWPSIEIVAPRPRGMRSPRSTDDLGERLGVADLSAWSVIAVMCTAVDDREAGRPRAVVRGASSWYYPRASVTAVSGPHLEASRLAEHVDETGAPCTRHPAISPASLYQLAMVGSRAPAFHHDCASKLQGLVMALDELSELTENGDPQLIRAVETALEASRELNALLNLNRTLTRPATRT
ncbi:MAG TPA: hypothetical protein VF516_01775, partial [Kofleriaceae bacterium]